MSYLDMCAGNNITVRDAMNKIDKLRDKIIFIVKDEKLCAALTDGDIRRYLLKGGTLDDNVVDAANKSPKSARSFSAARKLHHEKKYIAVPITDENDKITDIYVGRDDYQRKIALNIPVVINAGGKGTRLYPYTKILPKPLIPIGEIPIIEHIMQGYIKYGCENFHIIVNYKKKLLKAFFSENDTCYNIVWYDEKLPLGTAGGLSLLKGKINGTFFFGNCDTLIHCNFESALRFHREHENLITVICAYKNLSIPYGIVEMGEGGVIREMREKPELSFLINTGIYIVEPQVLEDIKPDVPVGFPDIIGIEREKGRRTAVYPISENEWLDMGQIPELEKCVNYMENKHGIRK